MGSMSLVSKFLSIQISTALHYVVCVYMGTVINKLSVGSAGAT